MYPCHKMNCTPVAVYSYYVGDLFPSEHAPASPEPSEPAGCSTPSSDSARPQPPPSRWYGCSGFTWSYRGKTWGLTYGSVLIPFIENAPENLREKFLKSQREGLRRTYDREILDSLELGIINEGCSSSTHSAARIVAVWSCPWLDLAIEQLLDVGWRFNGIEGELRAILPMLAVFLPADDMVWCKPGCISDALFALLAMIPREFSRGNPVMVVSSPFAGNMVPLSDRVQFKFTRASKQGDIENELSEDQKTSSPPLPSTADGNKSVVLYTPFFNSWSEGVVSGTSGPNNVIIVTDARTAMGSEGGPLFLGRPHMGKWWCAGMMLRSLCYWRDEHIGYSVAVNMRSALLEFLEKKSRMRPSRKTTLNTTVETACTTNVRKSHRQIVLVKCANHYSSGIPINEELGLILTCAHGVEQNPDEIFVFWGQNFRVRQVKAKLIYKTPPGKAYDIAVISVGPGSGIASIPMSKVPPKPGDHVLSIGYALHFGKKMDFIGQIDQPLISGGVVATVTPGNQKLQTSCCVQAGCSGGAILRLEDYTLLGVVVCNTAKHPESSTYPHLNFAVPALALKPFLEAYYKTKDPSVLRGICIPDKKVQRMWYFGEQESSSSAKRSKL